MSAAEDRKRLQIITRGCSKNKVDTEHILAQTCGEYELVDGEGEDGGRFVDVVAVNTCGFIGDAKEESINTVLEVAERKKAGTVGKIIVFGCLSQRYAAELPALIPEVDSWLGARDTDEVIKALAIAPDRSRDHRRVITEGGSYAYLKISEGCNRRCSYCAIPFIGGAHRSVPMEKLVEEAEYLASKGVRELIIIAQDTTYYGLDLYHRRALGELLGRLSEVKGIEWLRIHYSYPADFPEDVLDIMAANPKVCRYMDIPLQHISDKVLDNMRRNVDGRWTRGLIARMRAKVPGVVLRTTMIVGHPGEGSREFDELLDFVRDARFERLGAFTYSEEEGTYGAEHFKDTVRQSTKLKRYDKLMEVQREISLDYNRSRVGTVLKVLVDSWFADQSVFVCRSEFESPDVDGEILVKYSPELFGGIEPQSLAGKFIEVEITAADDYDLAADFVRALE